MDLMLTTLLIITLHEPPSTQRTGGHERTQNHPPEMQTVEDLYPDVL